MINLSATATSEIKRLQLKQQKQGVWFRLAVKQGGCSGLYYDMSFEQAVQQDDITFALNGIQVAIDSQTLGYVNGLKIDYSEDLMGSGFRFDNPQASSSCSCGNSFVLNE